VKKKRAELAEKINSCENSLRRMLKAYNVPEQPANPPVEFVSYNSRDNPVEFLQNVFTMKKGCIFAKEVAFLKPIIDTLQNALENPIQFSYSNANQLISELSAAFSNKKINLLISEDLIKEILPNLKSGAEILTKYSELKQFNLNITIRVTKQPIGNIVIKDIDQLLQFSFAPNNLLIGVFISRQTEIIDIFNQKLSSIYEQAIDIQDYLKTQQKVPLTELEKIYIVMI
jgi:hypothetical protein